MMRRGKVWVLRELPTVVIKVDCRARLPTSGSRVDGRNDCPAVHRPGSHSHKVVEVNLSTRLESL